MMIMQPFKLILGAVFGDGESGSQGAQKRPPLGSDVYADDKKVHRGTPFTRDLAKILLFCEILIFYKNMRTS